ncbi:LacI family transcriptional regulator [Pokkaliibacter plantistimulans]|uniref:LacI family transcriptional regulator n=1 Tax=Proteobacteria bacterium 228 TaxID=2083153 RepID=A0A2S5KVK2_9PROT|nr:LacI family DNA-binding transcriptional regulator [Pokkaliibacter plantistimulans]PPC78725.1 LacI family transcriptional regulator [Pokkaliibacter plantistimulans]
MTKKIKNMEEFAKLAGVSRPTASKYFESAEAVTTRSRQKIEAALDKFDYRPNLLASNLMRKDTRILGVLIPSLGDPFYADIVREIEIAALKHGYMAMIECSYGSAEMEKKAIENFLSVNVAGICVAPIGKTSSFSLLAKAESTIPLVYVDSTLQDSCSFVKTDNKQSIGLITQYMARVSSNPMFFPMPNVNNNFHERNLAYTEEMARLNQEPMILDVDVNQKTWEFERWGQQEMLKLIRTGKLHSRSIICANDRVAFGVISGLYKAGIEVGRDKENGFIVAGHDNQPLSDFTTPSLTTVAQDVKALGATAIEILLHKMGRITKEKFTDRVLIEGKLILRDSA